MVIFRHITALPPAKRGFLVWRKYSTGHDPLRVLFCGSDDFSIASLKALHGLRQSSPSRIVAIDVVCRTSKWAGRDRQVFIEQPIKKAAEELGIAVHERDTFTGWTPPSGTNLIVAVSFGRFVPPRILKATKYGGLNVHPSLLPELRGPAPIHRALLLNKSHTGVSLQTLDTEAFDRGLVLAQTPLPGISIKDDATPSSLINALKQEGAKMLVNAIRDSLFVHPLRPLELVTEEENHADKITKADATLSSDWDAETILIRERVLGRIHAGLPSTDHGLKQANLFGLTVSSSAQVANIQPGKLFIYQLSKGGEKNVGFTSADGKLINIKTMTVSGLANRPAAMAVQVGKLELESLVIEK